MVSPTSTADAGLPIRTSLRTSDLDEAGKFCRGLFYESVRVRPLGDTRTLDFVAEGLGLGAVTIGELRYGADVFVTTTDLGDAYHVLAPLAGAVQSRQLGHVVAADPSRAVVLQPVGDIELRMGADCKLLSVKVDRAALEREVDAALDRQVSSPMPLAASFPTGTGRGRSWAALVRQLLTDMRGHNALVNCPQIAKQWRDLLISGLALTVEHPYSHEPAARRPRTVKRALDAIQDRPGHPFTAGDLAAIAGVGVRVLQDAFKQHVGMSPMTYLRRYRLDGVHRELSNGDPWRTNVSDVAGRWGFAHLGRFAGEYRKRFGETPSQTLRDHR
jgi:AraC-like DNA-binding protein